MSFTTYTIVQTTELFLFLYIVDRYSRKIPLPFGLTGVGLCDLYLAALSSFTSYLICSVAMAFFVDVVYWSVLLKVVRLLGMKEEQGRMFGFLEAGRGVVDVVATSDALFVFVQFGEGKAGMQAGLLFYTVVALMAGIVTYFIVDDDEVKGGGKTSVNVGVLKGIRHVLSYPSVWSAPLGIFFVYATYRGLAYFIPFLEDIYMLPVALVGAYGIIDQYALKTVGGPIGGVLADKTARSPIVYLGWALLISAVAMLMFIRLPHQTMNVYIGMVAILGFGAIIFSQRAVFFAPMDEIGILRGCAGSVMTSDCIIGYMPATSVCALYGYLLDASNDITGYNYVSSVMIVFSLIGLICSTILVKRIKKQKLATAEATV